MWIKTFNVRDIGEKMCDSSFLHRGGVGGTVTSWACCESFAEILFLKERGKKIKKLAAVLTLSYLMDLWLCGKFCPTFEVRRSGGEEERFASGVRSCVMVCYWEFSPTHRDANNSLVSLNLWPTWMDGGMDGGMEGEKKSAQHIFIHMLACTPRNLSSQNPSVLDWFAPCFFLSGRLAINICCSPAWLREDIYCRIDACFLQYCSNFL